MKREISKRNSNPWSNLDSSSANNHHHNRAATEILIQSHLSDSQEEPDTTITQSLAAHTVVTEMVAAPANHHEVIIGIGSQHATTRVATETTMGIEVTTEVNMMEEEATTETLL